MIPSRSRHRRFLAALAVAFTVAALPLPAAAAPRGVKATFTITPLIEAVSVSQAGAFDVFARNDGKGTFTHTTFVGVLSAGTIASAPSGCSWRGATVTCSLPKLFAGQSATRRIVVTAPGGAGTLSMAGTLTVDSASDNPNASSRDTFRTDGSIGVRNDADFFGRWQAAHGAAVTFSTAGVGGANGQSTSVKVPSFGADYPATLEETADAIVCGGSPIGGFGKTVELSMANGQTVTPHLTVTMTYDKSTANGRTPYTVAVVHQRDNGTCEFPPRDCDDNPGFCFDAFWQGSGYHKKLVIVMELPTNGRGRGI
jgi:hypothetical protein